MTLQMCFNSFLILYSFIARCYETKYLSIDIGDDVDSFRSFREDPLGDVKQFQEKFPLLHRFVEAQSEFVLPADPANGVPSDITVVLLEPISAGNYGAVMKASANGELIAFKVMRSVPTTQEQLERVLNSENKEIYIMAKLSKAMEEVTGPRCGAKLHYFRIEGHEYRGFGMELFPHPTVVGVMKDAKLTMVDCSKSVTHTVKCWWAKSTQDLFYNSARIRKMWLRDKNVQTLYYNGLAALQKMWSNGVVHNDMHANNLLIDAATGIVKIIDFGMAYMPTKEQYLRFVVGVSADYYRYTFTFVMGALFPKTYSKSLKRSDMDRVFQMIYELNREVYLLARTDGKNPYPQSPEMLQVLENFKKLHGIENDPEYDDLWPNFGDFQVVKAPIESSFWEVTDSGHPLKAYTLPSAALRFVKETLETDAKKGKTLAEKVAEQIEKEKRGLQKAGADVKPIPESDRIDMHVAQSATNYSGIRSYILFVLGFLFILCVVKLCMSPQKDSQAYLLMHTEEL